MTKTKKEKGIISGYLLRETWVGGFLRFSERTLRSIAKSMRPITTKHRDTESFQRFLKFNISSALLLSIFSAQIAWAVTDDRVMKNEQDSSRPTVISESSGIKEEASANPSIKISTHEGLISLEARDADLREVLDALSKVSGVQIDHGDMEESSPVRISVSFKNLPFDKAIKTVTNQLPAGGYALFEESGEAKQVYVITKKGKSSVKVTEDPGKGKAQEVAADSRGRDPKNTAKTNKSDFIRDEVLDRVTQAFSGALVSTISVSTIDITDPDDTKKLPSIDLVRTETGRLKMVQGAGFFVDVVGLFEPLKNQVDLTWEVTRDVVFNGRSLDLYKVTNERGSIHIWMDDDGTIPKSEQFIDGTKAASVTVEYADSPDGKKQQVRSITAFPITGRILEQIYHAQEGKE